MLFHRPGESDGNVSMVSPQLHSLFPFVGTCESHRGIAARDHDVPSLRRKAVTFRAFVPTDWSGTNSPSRNRSTCSRRKRMAFQIKYSLTQPSCQFSTRLRSAWAESACAM